MTVVASEVPVVEQHVAVAVDGGSDDDWHVDGDADADDASMMVTIHHLADADADDMMVDHTLHYSNDTLVVHHGADDDENGENGESVVVVVVVVMVVELVVAVAVVDILHSQWCHVLSLERV